MKNTIVALLAALAIAAAPACSTVLKPVADLAPYVAQYAADASIAVDAVDSAQAAWFAANPNPAQQAIVVQGIADARAAIQAALAATAGVQDLTQAQVDDAWKQFQGAWQALEKILGKYGGARRFGASGLLQVNAFGRQVNVPIVVARAGK